jgi:hypothetical protein
MNLQKTWLAACLIGALPGCSEGVTVGSRGNDQTVTPGDQGNPPNGTGGSGGAAPEPEPETACSIAAEIFEVACPDLQDIYVTPTGSPNNTGTLEDPTSDFELVRGICAAVGCHVHLAAGTYSYDAGIPIAAPCVHVEGGLDPSAGWVRGDEPSIVEQQSHDNGAFVGTHAGGKLRVEGVTVSGGSSAVLIWGGSLGVVQDSTFTVDYEAITAAAGAHGLRVCNVDISGGYGGVDVTGQSFDVILEDVTIDAGYAGVDLSYESHDVALKNVTIDAGYDAVGLSWGSYGVTLDNVVAKGGYSALGVGWGSNDVVARNSTLEGSFAAATLGGGFNVDLMDGRLIGGEFGVLEMGFGDVTDIRVIGNHVQGGTLPPSDPDKNIEIRDNIIE